MILTNEEIEALTVRNVDARAVERAVLEKLCAGVEMPEPIKFGIDFRADDPRPIGHTADQMLAYGSAQRLKALEDAEQAAGPDDSYQDEWFKAKADACRRIRALKGEA